MDGMTARDATPTRGVILDPAVGGRAGEACDVHARAFGAEDRGRNPHADDAPGLMHAQPAIHGGMLRMTDHSGPDDAPSTAFGRLQFDVADGRAWWDRSVAAGCSEVLPYGRQPCGDDRGLLRGPIGLGWGILQSASEAAA